MLDIILIILAAFCLIISTGLFIAAKMFIKKNTNSKVDDVSHKLTKITNLAYFLFMAGLILSLASKFV